MKKRIACIDYGLKRIGIAISDETHKIARALPLVEAHRQAAISAQRIVDALKTYDLERILVGHPIQMNGKRGLSADAVQEFVSILQPHFSCEIILWDERLSSVQAHRTLMEAGMNRKQRTKVVDSLTALILLQSFLGY